MHDGQIEDRLRSILRAEGDGLPMTITSSELERRLQMRRRRTRGRWVSIVAAAAAITAVGAIADLGNGWLAPAVGTRVSPPPSPSIGLSRIEQGAPGRLVLEIRPTASGGGVVQPLHENLGPTDYVASVKVLCLGDGSVSFTDRIHVIEVTCTTAAALDPVFQPDPILVPVIDGSFDTVLTVTPDIRYTMLVETVPVPDHLPKLSTPDGSISMLSETASSAPGLGSPVIGSGPQQTATGRMDGPTEWVQVVCLGPGDVSYTLGPVDHATAGTTSETVCDGVPREEEIAIDFSGEQIITVTAGKVSWQLVATRAGPLPTVAPVVSPTPAR